MSICRFLIATILFKYGEFLDTLEEFTNRERSGSHIEETIISSFQKDVRFCRNILPSNRPTYIASRNSQKLYEVEIVHRAPMIVTAIKLIDRKTHVHFPLYDTYFYDIQVFYTIHRYNKTWNHYKDEKGEPKVFVITHMEQEENGGLSMFKIEPNIIAHKLKMRVVHPLVSRHHEKFLSIQPLGCMDEQGTKDLQYVDENVLPEFEKQWVDVLQPDYDEGCAVFDFEKGNLQNWTFDGKAFTNQPTYGDNRYNRGNKNLTGFAGKWWISSYENHPSNMAPTAVMSLENTGFLKSPSFHVTSPKYSFLIGGGDTTGLIGVEVIIFNRAVVKVFLKHYVTVMRREEIDLSQYLMKPAILKLTDGSSQGYLMFDDFRTVERCNDVCSKALGMESGYIKDEMISSSLKHKDRNFAVKYSRLSPSFAESKVFKSTEHNWLKIQFPIVSIIDGWATQGYSSDHGNTECSLEKYTVTYSTDDIAWRYISIRTKDGTHIPIEYSHKKGIINRKWLNPRVTGKFIQFTFGDTSKDQPTICFRVEIYGCEKLKLQDDKMVMDDRLKSLREKQEESKDSYELKLLNIPKLYIDQQQPIKLSCSSDPVMLGLATAFEWYEIVYVSKVVFPERSISLSIKLKKSFRKRTIGCQIYRGSAKLFNQEFVLIERSQGEIVPFVTQEAGLEYRGGRLIHSDPAVLYNQGTNTFFFSVHLANIVHPFPVLISTRKYCPRKDAYHSPYLGYQFHGRYEKFMDCFDAALANGSRTFYYEGKKCYGGEGIHTWSEYFKWDSVSRYNWNQCELIDSPLEKEFGSPCLSTCKQYKKMQSASFPRPFNHAFYRMGYVIPTTRSKFFFYLNGKMIYRRFIKYEQLYKGEAIKYVSDIFETVEDRLRRPNRYRGVEYISDTRYNPNRNEAPCMSYFSPYASEPWGSGHLLTFVYACRNKNFFKDQKILLRWSYRNPHRPKWFETRIVVRNTGQPIITLDKKIGICAGEYQEIKPTVKMNDVMFTAKKNLRYTWYKVGEQTFFDEEKLTEVETSIDNQTLIYRKKDMLIFYKAQTSHSSVYEFKVDSPLGLSKTRTRITIHEDYPRITWVTPSPHEVIEGKTDIVGIHLSTNENVKEIIWTKNGVRITESKHYSFIDDNGEAYQKKRMLIKNLKSGLLSGRYEIKLVGEHCTFDTFVDVLVLEKPSMTLIPHTGRNNFLSVVKDSTQTLTAIVRGGHPPVQLSDMVWTKNGAQIVAGLKGRITVMTSETEANTWRSVLTIKNIKGRDQGEYAFTVKSRSDTVAKSKVIYVRNPHEINKQQHAKKTPKKTSFSNRLSLDDTMKVCLCGLILFITLKNMTW